MNTDEVSTTSSSTGTGSHAVRPQGQDVLFSNLEARGIITESEGEISLVDVPIITPNGDVLVSRITIDVRQTNQLQYPNVDETVCHPRCMQVCIYLLQALMAVGRVPCFGY
jgi:hypothetical protein